MATNTKSSGNGMGIVHRSTSRVLDGYSVAMLSRIFETKSMSTYDRLAEMLRSHRDNYTIRDIEKFYSSLTPGVNTIDAGVFVSAAINNIIRDGDMVVLRNHRITLHYMGTRLSRGTEIIEGGALNFLGYKMRGGTLILKGDALNFAATEMTGGNIEVLGRLASSAADGMHGGRLIVNQRAGYNIGNNASPNAYIILLGGYEHLAPSCKARLHDD